jgi:hypothetical protein
VTFPLSRQCLRSVQMDESRSWERIWNTWAPPKCWFFIWLVAHSKCWTADCLARRGMPRPKCCPLCDQEEETINHLLVGCVFAREFWSLLLQQVGLQALSPRPTENSFLDWWERANNATSGMVRKGANYLIILGPGFFGTIVIVVFFMEWLQVLLGL